MGWYTSIDLQRISVLLMFLVSNSVWTAQQAFLQYRTENQSLSLVFTYHPTKLWPNTGVFQASNITPCVSAGLMEVHICINWNLYKNKQQDNFNNKNNSNNISVIHFTVLWFCKIICSVILTLFGSNLTHFDIWQQWNYSILYVILLAKNLTVIRP